MWTCIECGVSYDERTGDVDERTCCDCIDMILNYMDKNEEEEE